MKDEVKDVNPNLYLRKQADSDDEKEEWDDSSLIKAYDKAVATAKRHILSKLQGEFDLKTEDIEELLTDNSISKKKKKKKNKKNSAEKVKWAVGSACRAIYGEDGEEYEAEIISLGDNNTCVVRYIGYDNIEEILLDELEPSLGKHVIKQQKEDAEGDFDMEESEILDDSDVSSLSEGVDEKAPPHVTNCKPTAASHPVFHHYPQRLPMFEQSQLPPPPPPIPPQAYATSHKYMNPMASVPIPNPLSSDETHNAMMLSWYMCGYYTGYYQREMNDRQNSSARH